jgi:hypothetical protein
MMAELDPMAVANRLRETWLAEPPPDPDPEERHEQSFLAKVCGFLGVEPSVTNTTYVAHLMSKLNLKGHEFDEYPKMLTVKDSQGRVVPAVYPDDHEQAGLPVIFENAEEEAAYGKKGK